MINSWRWFGPSDPVSLTEIKQAGVTDIVTALHHVRCGDLWTVEEIQERQQVIAAAGMVWSVVESVAIHESIKTRSDDFKSYIATYKQCLKNLASCGIQTICYNFMPILDWTRSELNKELEDGGKVLFCNMDAVAAFELFILKREGAEATYSPVEIEGAKKYFSALDEVGIQELSDSILLGLPGTVDDFSVEDFRAELTKYDGIDDAQLRQNMYDFLNEISPLCDELNVKMAIHPDDPPRPIFGLPRIMSCAEDVAQMYRECPSKNIGLTLCTGSFGGSKDNNPAAIFEQYAERIYFAHFRNVTFNEENEKSFFESNHLTGQVDMARAMMALIQEEARRGEGIPVRPDHGKLMESDEGKGSYSGYSGMGRMLGLAELRGLEFGLKAGLSK